VKEGEMEIHQTCPACKEFISADVKIEQGKLTGKNVYKKE